MSKTKKKTIIKQNIILQSEVTPHFFVIFIPNNNLYE